MWVSVETYIIFMYTSAVSFFPGNCCWVFHYKLPLPILQSGEQGLGLPEQTHTLSLSIRDESILS